MNFRKQSKCPKMFKCSSTPSKRMLNMLCHELQKILNMLCEQLAIFL